MSRTPPEVRSMLVEDGRLVGFEVRKRVTFRGFRTP